MQFPPHHRKTGAAATSKKNAPEFFLVGVGVLVERFRGKINGKEPSRKDRRNISESISERKITQRSRRFSTGNRACCPSSTLFLFKTNKGKKAKCCEGITGNRGGEILVQENARTPNKGGGMVGILKPS